MYVYIYISAEKSMLTRKRTQRPAQHLGVDRQVAGAGGLLPKRVVWAPALHPLRVGTGAAAGL